MHKTITVIIVVIATSLMPDCSIAQESPDRLTLTVRETAGIRRFGYPVTMTATLPEASLTDVRHARLIRLPNGSALPSQMTMNSRHADGSIENLEIDVIQSPGPLETMQFQLETGSDVTSVLAQSGLELSETDEFFQVSAYRIPKDLRSLVQQVNYRRDYLRGDGIRVAAIEGNVIHDLAAARNIIWTVEKRGPLQVRLRCRGIYPAAKGLDEMPFELMLEFVSSKSWIGITHRIPQAFGRQIRLETIADFQLQGQLLWDLDTGYWLYGVLESGESLTLLRTAGDWQCELAGQSGTSVYAKGVPENRTARGWGHFQEATTDGNVVAFGVAESESDDSLAITMASNGTLTASSVPGIGEESIQQRIFFHFVPVPLQHTARTSPPSMMRPLEQDQSQ
jgi:hypothetical protein